MDYTQWWEPHLHWFWIVLCIFVIMMFVCAASRMRRAGAYRSVNGSSSARMPFGCCGRRPSRQIETPGEILDRRYAAGEISGEEYARVKGDIESNESENAR